MKYEENVKTLNLSSVWRRTDKPQISANKTADKPQIKGRKLDEAVALLVNNANYTIPQIADKLQISVSSVRTHLERLKREKGLVHVGSRKTGHWEFQHKAFGFGTSCGSAFAEGVAPTLTTSPSAGALCTIKKKSRKTR